MDVFFLIGREHPLRIHHKHVPRWRRPVLSQLRFDSAENGDGMGDVLLCMYELGIYKRTYK